MYCASATLLLQIKVPDLCSCWTDRKIKEVKKNPKTFLTLNQGVHTSNILMHFKIAKKQNKITNICNLQYNQSLLSLQWF